MKVRGLLVYTTPQGTTELIINATDRDQTERIAVGSEPGPRSAVWNFIGKAAGDIYIGERSTMSMVKISMHESGVRRLAYVDEYADKKLPVGFNRRLVDWSPTEIAPGWRHELEIWVPADEVNTVAKIDGKRSSVQKIHWVPAPPPGSATVFVLLTCQRQRADYQELRFDNPNLTPLAGLWLQRRTGIELAVIFASEVELDGEMTEHFQALGTDLRKHDPEMRNRLHAEGRRSILFDVTDLPPRFVDQSII